MVMGPCWGRAGQAAAPRDLGAAVPGCTGRTGTALQQHSQPLLPPAAPHTPGQPPKLTGGRLSLPAAWRLPRSSPAASGSHRGTASLSSGGGGDARGQQGWIRLPLLPPPQPCWAAQTCTLLQGAGGAFALPGAGMLHPHHGPSAARFLGVRSPVGGIPWEPRNACHSPSRSCRSQ